MQADSSLATALDAASIGTVYPAPRGIPTALSRSYNVDGTVTDCLVQLFADRILLGISQMDGKLGSWVTCDVEESVIDSKTRFRVDIVLGQRDDPLPEVYARRITEQIASLRKSKADPCPPVLLGISIKDRDPKIFGVLVNLVVKLYQEAVLVASS